MSIIPQVQEQVNDSVHNRSDEEEVKELNLIVAAPIVSNEDPLIIVKQHRRNQSSLLFSFGG